MPRVRAGICADRAAVQVYGARQVFESDLRQLVLLGAGHGQGGKRSEARRVCIVLCVVLCIESCCVVKRGVLCCDACGSVLWPLTASYSLLQPLTASYSLLQPPTASYYLLQHGLTRLLFSPPPGRTKHGYKSKFVDWQRLRLQECADEIPAGR